jgi:hypothetical protein
MHSCAKRFFILLYFVNNNVKSLHYNSKVNRIGDVMVKVLTSSAVDRWFESRSGKTKDYKN